MLAHLGELQLELAELRQYQYLWNNPGPGGTLKEEDIISDWVRRELQTRLRAVLFEREAHVASKGTGVGTRIDIEATVTTATHPPGKALVIVEAKRVTNKHLMSDMHDQLVQRYMIPRQARKGIYLVYWAEPDQRDTGPDDKAKLIEELEMQSAEASARGLQIRPHLLDVSWH